MTQTSVPQSTEVKAFIEAGCTFEGVLTFTGVVRLNGKLKGDISTDDTLIIGETGEVQGNVNVGSLLLNGKVVGDIKASQKVELNATALFQGTLEAPLLITAQGAQLTGQVKVIRGQVSSKLPVQKKESK